jgi:hypothetical protein
MRVTQHVWHGPICQLDARQGMSTRMFSYFNKLYLPTNPPKGQSVIQQKLPGGLEDSARDSRRLK